MPNPLFEQHQNQQAQPETHQAEVIDFEAVRASRIRPNSLPDQVIAHQRAEAERRFESVLPSVDELKVNAIKGIDFYIEQLRTDALNASSIFASDTSQQMWNTDQIMPGYADVA